MPAIQKQCQKSKKLGKKSLCYDLILWLSQVPRDSDHIHSVGKGMVQHKSKFFPVL